MRFFIGGWLTISTLVVFIGGQEAYVWESSPSCNLILIEFYEQSGNHHSSMLDIENYSIADLEGTPIRIDSIAVVTMLKDEYGEIVPDSTTVIALKTERLVKYKTTYILTVQNIRNKEGMIQPSDTSYYYFNGFQPNLIETPNVDWE